MTDINPKWFKRDFWTHQEAACLFHGMNPDSDTLHYVFSPLYQSKAVNSMTIETFRIFESADWSKICSSSADTEKRKYNDYFQLAKLKSIHVSKQLLDAKDKFEKEEMRRREEMEKKIATTNESEKLISGKMLNILKPIIEIIEDFENSTIYKRSGVNIHQGLIMDWLDTKLSTDHEKRYLKELITEFYGITTARKK